jgi:molybdenum cofactor biosynthesis enzyme MoaA
MKNLDDVSPTMCLAKWVEGTLYLSSGTTHSCHLVQKSKSSIEDILKDPANLFNTPQKKAERKIMLDGMRQPGCASCNKIELTTDEPSDRMLKNNWHYDHKEKVLKASHQDNFSPSELEIEFDNVCNLKCMYCKPSCSSSWVSETMQYGTYDNGYGTIEEYTTDEERAIYTKAFWDWFPTIYDNLKVFRITGGEPFLSKQTIKMLDYLIDNPNPELFFAINSNLSVPYRLIESHLNKINEMQEQKKIKKFVLFTSMESTGSRAEYIRYGLNYDLWKKNLISILDNYENIEVTIMSTYNALSVTSFDSLLDLVEELKNKYGRYRVTIDVIQMKNPAFQCIDILAGYSSLLSYIERSLNKVSNNKSYTEIEKIRMKRIFEVSKMLSEKNMTPKRNMFAKFVDEYDRRKKTDFLSTFPELESFYYDCFKIK